MRALRFAANLNPETARFSLTPRLVWVRSPVTAATLPEQRENPRKSRQRLRLAAFLFGYSRRSRETRREKPLLGPVGEGGFRQPLNLLERDNDGRTGNEVSEDPIHERASSFPGDGCRSAVFRRSSFRIGFFNSRRNATRNATT